MTPQQTIAIAYKLSPDVRFEKEGHRYFVGDREYSSVSSILDAQGLTVWLNRLSPEQREAAAIRGSYVHKACELADSGKLNRATVDPQIAGYLEAYEQWKAQTDFRPVLIEQPLASPPLRYAGTPDRIGYVGERIVIVDLKTGGAYPSVRLQLAAYGALLANVAVPLRWVLYVTKDGKFRLRQFPAEEYATDVAAFAAMARAEQWKRRYLYVEESNPKEDDPQESR